MLERYVELLTQELTTHDPDELCEFTCRHMLNKAIRETYDIKAIGHEQAGLDLVFLWEQSWGVIELKYYNAPTKLAPTLDNPLATRPASTGFSDKNLNEFRRGLEGIRAKLNLLLSRFSAKSYVVLNYVWFHEPQRREEAFHDHYQQEALAARIAEWGVASRELARSVIPVMATPGRPARSMVAVLMEVR